MLSLVVCCLGSMVVLTKLEARSEVKQGFREDTALEVALEAKSDGV